MVKNTLLDIDYGLLERAVFRLKEQSVLLPEIINKVTRVYMGFDKDLPGKPMWWRKGETLECIEK